MPPPEPEETQPPLTEKQPLAMSMPPAAEKVEVEVWRLATPWMENMVPGLVVPIPRFPVSDSLAASVRMPDLRVENIKSPFALP